MNPQEDTIARYFALVQDRPDLFTQSEGIPLVLDEEKMRAFARDTGKKMGLVHDQSPYWLVLADLCQGANGRLYSYGRVVYCNERSNGAAALVRRGDRFGLLKVFRHGIRAVSVETPRGFHEDKALSPEENIAKELGEELGLSPEDCRIRRLGTVTPDGGLCSGCAQIFLAEIDDGAVAAATGQEGILSFHWYTEEQLLDAVRTGVITDAFTLSAYALYEADRRAGGLLQRGLWCR